MDIAKLTIRDPVRFLAPLVFLAIALVAYWQADKIELLGFDPLDAAFFPRLIAVAMIALAGAELMLTVLRMRKPPVSKPLIPRSAFIRMIAGFSLFTLFCINVRLEWIPFPISGAIFLVLCGLVYVEKFRRGPLTAIAAVAIVLPVALDILFRTLFYVSLP